MIKQLLSLITVFCLAFGCFAQDLELLNVQDTTYMNAQDNLVELTPQLKNASMVSRTLGAQRIQNDMTLSHENHFCWDGICYAPSTTESITFSAVKANGLDTTFLLSFSPKGDTGTSVVTYRFYDINDTTVFIDQTFTFIVGATTDISETFQAKGYQLSLAYPQPAIERVFFNYTLPAGSEAKLILTDLTGRAFRTETLNPLQNRVELAIEGLAPGYYLAMMVDKGVTLGSQKVIVR